MDTSLIDLDRIPTLEELRAFFQCNDWSTAQLSDPEDRDNETVETIEYIKSLMDEHFDLVAHEKICRRIIGRRKHVGENAGTLSSAV